MEVYSWEHHLFLWAIYTMAMLNNQRGYIYMVVSELGYALQMAISKISIGQKSDSPVDLQVEQPRKDRKVDAY
jgi:hypothetical protein